MKQILIVDDKEENLYYLEALLTGAGFTVTCARHGAEALVKARQAPPDLIISDLLMPVMDGYTLLRHWKLDRGLKQIPFIVYTATYTEAEDERLALNLGADAFILKPAEPEDFLLRLRAVQANAVAEIPAPLMHQVGDEKELLKVYSETLIRKLEEKTLQLEEANRSLKQDIAERKRVEESLRESEERFRATFEQAAVGIAHVDVHGKFLRVNDKLCEIIGYPRDDLLGQTFSDLTLPEDIAENEAARRDMLDRALGTYSAEKRYRRKTGEAVWCSIVTTLLRDGAGAPKYFISVITDISERRSLQEQFLRAQRMESLGTLAGGVAHDLNNMLSPIIMGLSLLKQSQQNADCREVIAAIERSAQRGTSLVKQVLSFARGTEAPQKALTLAEVVGEFTSICSTTFPKNIGVQTDIPADLWPVLGNATQLHQVLLNLGVNARDAMAAGGKLHIAARNASLAVPHAVKSGSVPPGNYVIVRVADSGTGMSPEVLGRIFEPFFTTKEVDKGTGLGLSTALAIMRGHRGFIDVRSQPGAGTTFELYLPAASAAATGSASPFAVRTLPRGHGELILLVDDESSILNITRQMLETFGYRVLTADDGTQAIGLFALNAREVAVVVTDLMMPVLDGTGLAAALHRLDPTVPMIAISGLNTSVAPERLARVGIAHSLAKPFTSEALLRLLHEIIAAGRARTPADQPQLPLP